MKWLEVIEIRSVRNERDAIIQELLKPLTKLDQENGPESIILYRHASMDTDLSVHLQWETEVADNRGSDLGLRLASALKEYGRVNHSIWVKEERQ